MLKVFKTKRSRAKTNSKKNWRLFELDDMEWVDFISRKLMFGDQCYIFDLDFSIETQ